MGLLFVALIVSFVGLLFWAQRAGSQQQERFFQAVMSGDPSVLLALCDPALRDQIDAPVLAQWMGQVRKQLGDYKGLSSSDFSTSANTTEQGTLIQSEGTVHFQSGDAKSELEFLNNLLVKFSIESEKIPPAGSPAWMTLPFTKSEERISFESSLTVMQRGLLTRCTKSCAEPSVTTSSHQ
jgi:hypothetical protein